MSRSGRGEQWSNCVLDPNNNMASAVRRWRAGIEHLTAVHHRLGSVQIEQEDWRVILSRYDSAATLYYLDLPNMPDTRVECCDVCPTH